MHIRTGVKTSSVTKQKWDVKFQMRGDCVFCEVLMML